MLRLFEIEIDRRLVGSPSADLLFASEPCGGMMDFSESND